MLVGVGFEFPLYSKNHAKTLGATLRLDLTLRQDIFAEELAREIAAGGLTVVDAIERLLTEHLEDSVSKSLGDRLIKAPRAIVYDHYFRNRFENLSGLLKRGYSTWYPEVRFSTSKQDSVEINAVEATGFELGYIRYGDGYDRDHSFSSKELKTQTNHTVRLNKLTLPCELFGQAIRLIESPNTIEQPYIANLTAADTSCEYYGLEGFRIVSFDHVMTGERKFCRCHSDVHSIMLSDARERAPSYTPGSWPHCVIALLERATYSDRLCHFCIAQQHGEDALSDWYGDQIQEHFGPYVDLLVRGANMDVRTAKAEAKRRLAISRWVREDETYRLVRRLFPTSTIRREASPRWLGQQRLDLYLPDLALAIEHQGEQHYRPILGFGGERAFEKVKERDERKRMLCRENGVTLVEIRFDTPLTLPNLRARLGRWLSQ